MAGPWEKYAAAEAGPWTKYGGAETPASDSPRMDAFVGGLKDFAGKNLVLGGLRGAADIGETLQHALNPMAWGTDAKAQRRAGIEGAMDSLGAEKDSTLYGTGRLTTNIAGTVGVGGALGAGAKSLGAGPGVANALTSGGFTAGRAAPGAAGFAAHQFGRIGAGGSVGGASAALVDSDSAGAGAAIGAVLPPAILALGKAGGGAANLWRRLTASGETAAAAKLAEALGAATPTERQAIIERLRSAPEYVKGSRPTTAQALQSPQASTFEQVLADTPGGDALKSAYAEQGKARIAALERYGAQTHLGAASDMATTTGDKVGAVLRTQAMDDRAAARAAWESLYKRGADDGVALRLPLDAMDEAMRPLGRGTVGAGKDARAVVDAAKDIGTIEAPAIRIGKGAKQESLLDAVKRAGGINQNTVSSKLLGGEVSSLREEGLGRVVYKNRGQSAARMAENMHEAGFLPDNDPATLLDMLRRGGRDTFSSGADMSSNYRAMAEAAMGDAPQAQRFPVAVPFDEFQRLWRSAGDLAAKNGERAGGATEAGVLSRVGDLLRSRVDDAAAGNLLADEAMSPGFRDQYFSARDMTRQNATRYDGGNNISQILRKPTGQNYTLTGDEVTGKLWHGGAGLAGDVSNLKQVLSANNLGPVIDDLQRFVMTDAASKTTKAGNLAAALPSYVEARMPGLRELLDPEQLKALVGIAEDIKRAARADAVGASKGSPTYRNAANALSLGIMDSPGLRNALSRVPMTKGLAVVPLDWMRGKVGASQANALAALMADAPTAANALEAIAQTGKLKPSELGELARLLGQSSVRALPVAASQ